MLRFTVAYWCVLVVALLPIVCAAIAKWGTWGVAAGDNRFNNHEPRQWLAAQGGWRLRANAAQANSFEALPFFIGAVIIAHQMQAHQLFLDLLCLLFVFLRIFYVIVYVGDMPRLRSSIWTLALLCNIAIFVLGYR